MGWTMQLVFHSIKRSNGRMGQPLMTPTPWHPLCRGEPSQGRADSSVRSSPEGHTGPDHAQFSVDTTAVRNTAVLVSTAGTPNYPK
jgi:hypothetical protein